MDLGDGVVELWFLFAQLVGLRRWRRKRGRISRYEIGLLERCHLLYTPVEPPPVRRRNSQRAGNSFFCYCTVLSCTPLF
jgi:hypothetical protein